MSENIDDISNRIDILYDNQVNMNNRITTVESQSAHAIDRTIYLRMALDEDQKLANHTINKLMARINELEEQIKQMEQRLSDQNDKYEYMISRVYSKMHDIQQYVYENAIPPQFEIVKD